ncbi:MAG: phytoene desaturase family protein [Luminiphilus sp.]|nr:phytoene desaturase family protein [Luminiphilus sp.]
MTARHAIVIGAGAGGLAAGIDLARSGFRVTMLERAATPGGKMHMREVDDRAVDGGPTVLTMRSIFEQLFSDAGARLSDRLTLTQSPVIARHAWSHGGTLDLYPDLTRSRQCIEAFAGSEDAAGFERFYSQSARIHRALAETFMAAPKPNPMTLVGRVLRQHHPSSLIAARPSPNLWQALGQFFSDERLRQLFARYATYVGSSPLSAPATLMLIAHVELEGVWLVEGGMHRLAKALATLGQELGIDLHLNTHVNEVLVKKGRAAGVRLEDGTVLPADVVVFNGDTDALATGQLGSEVMRAVKPRPRQKRALSALTWCIKGNSSGFELDHHNVFFESNYPSEFSTIFSEREVPTKPTVYLCAQDRGPNGSLNGSERLLMLVNAPADGDTNTWSEDKVARTRDNALAVLERCGLNLIFRDSNCVSTTPTDWHGRFPGSGGSLYGGASHGIWSSFTRPGARSRLKGLYLSGGSVHPGPGVPMAALSGRLAASAVLRDIG